MNLQTFITQTLTDIFNGVLAAQKSLPPDAIAPSTRVNQAALEHNLSVFQTVDFEVSVRIDESAESSGKLKVATVFIDAGMGGESSKTQGHTSTLRFKVPIMLPRTGQKAKNPA